MILVTYELDAQMGRNSTITQSLATYRREGTWNDRTTDEIKSAHLFPSPTRRKPFKLETYLRQGAKPRCLGSFQDMKRSDTSVDAYEIGVAFRHRFRTRKVAAWVFEIV